MKDVRCPYCNHEDEINHDDGYGYEEGKTYNQMCGHCKKYYVFTTTILFHYDVDKADCLNGGEHDWKPTHTYPKSLTEMYCTQCGEARNPTDEEKVKFEIPSS